MLLSKLSNFHKENESEYVAWKVAAIGYQEFFQSDDIKLHDIAYATIYARLLTST